ncbi:uncharacterized protein LAJ45_10844 [Morchella importuna]|uniref:uncharacterized protein n=1 Tax=Morchella importuna TaxID=1174673 RepID=UPI001E8EA911|nr:uncharacterized protein LAJ45_10844 [Morchella importuna]KAH8145180.1 hypothetical protein LAJ45_10844 [Morchella importuna]
MLDSIALSICTLSLSTRGVSSDRDSVLSAKFNTNIDYELKNTFSPNQLPRGQSTNTNKNTSINPNTRMLSTSPLTPNTAQSTPGSSQNTNQLPNKKRLHDIDEDDNEKTHRKTKNTNRPENIRNTELPQVAIVPQNCQAYPGGDTRNTPKQSPVLSGFTPINKSRKQNPCYPTSTASAPQKNVARETIVQVKFSLGPSLVQSAQQAQQQALNRPSRLYYSSPAPVSAPPKVLTPETLHSSPTPLSRRIRPEPSPIVQETSECSRDIPEYSRDIPSSTAFKMTQASKAKMTLGLLNLPKVYTSIRNSLKAEMQNVVGSIKARPVIKGQGDRQFKEAAVIVMMMMTAVVRQPEDALAKGKSVQYSGTRATFHNGYRGGPRCSRGILYARPPPTYDGMIP